MGLWVLSETVGRAHRKYLKAAVSSKTLQPLHPSRTRRFFFTSLCSYIEDLDRTKMTASLCHCCKWMTWERKNCNLGNTRCRLRPQCMAPWKHLGHWCKQYTSTSIREQLNKPEAFFPPITDRLTSAQIFGSEKKMVAWKKKKIFTTE